MVSEKVYEMLEEKMDGFRKEERREKDADQRKTYDEVFDTSTLMALYKLFTKEVIETLDFPISTGKEGNVFRGTSPSGELLAVKIYRISTATFRNIMKYIRNNPRYRKVSKKKRDIIFNWARKEHDNLARMEKNGIKAPRPISVWKNILVMEYIGTERRPAPLLKDVTMEEPPEKFDTILEEYSKLYNRAELVHADLSEYNVLITEEDEPVLIDVGQSASRSHPQAEEWLRRDIRNISNYFRKKGVKTDWRANVARIKTGEEGGGDDDGK